MSATAAASIRRLVLGNLRTALCRASTSHASIRNFHLQPACEAVMKVEMPSLSPTMDKGTIIKWHKKEGEAVSPGDVLCDIQTDKAVVSMEYDDEGILAKIIKPDNSQDIEVGTLIALMVEEGDDWQNVEVPGDAEVASPAAGAPAAAAAPPPAAPTGSIPGIKVEMPSLSPTMEVGTIIKWHKKEGDVVSPGDVLCDIQTDKAVVSMEYDDEGILAKILKPDNSSNLKVGELIALMVLEGQDWTDVQVPAMTDAPPAAAAAAPSAQASAPSTTPPPMSTLQEAVIIDDDLPGVGPSVKKLLHEYNIPPASVPGSGPKGNLLKGDLLSFIQSKGLHKVDPASLTVGHGAPAAAPTPQAPSPMSAAPSPTPGEPYVDIPLTNMRKVIAKRLTESKTTVPHAYATMDCSMQTVTNARKMFIAQGHKVSMNDFIIKAAGFALERSPKVNAINQGETAQTAASVDISVAVATEGGLITPIVKNVPALGVAEISQTVRALAEKARAGKLQPHEFQGGSFSISNLGMYGIKEFSAVINPPQVAILAIGTTRLTVGDRNDIVSAKMAVTLSYDSRVMDEQDATRFLELFRLALENPDVLVGGRAGEMTPRNADLAFGSSAV